MDLCILFCLVPFLVKIYDKPIQRIVNFTVGKARMIQPPLHKYALNLFGSPLPFSWFSVKSSQTDG